MRSNKLYKTEYHKKTLADCTA